MKISPREMVLTLVTVGVVLAGSLWYIVSNHLDDWRSLADEIEQTRLRIHHYRTAIRMRPKWRKELDTLQSGLRVFEDNHRSVSPELMKTIKNIASRYHLEITRSQPYTEKPTGDLFELGINCTWEGDTESLVHFLVELQQQGVRYDVRQLNINPVGKEDRLRGNMVIHCAYTRRPPKPKPQPQTTDEKKEPEKTAPPPP